MTNASLPKQIVKFESTFELQLGGRIDHCQIEYRRVGNIGAPVILVMGGISANKFVTSEGNSQAGWWNDIVGPGKAIDLERFQVLSIEYLGGNGNSSTIDEPLLFNRANTILPQDQAVAIHKLLIHLNISHLHAVVGNSYGGFVALSFAKQYPSLTRQLFVICSAHTTPNKAKANRSLQREIIRLTLNSSKNQEDSRQGLKLARSLAMLAYRADDEFDTRFESVPYEENGEFRFQFQDYLEVAGNRFIDSFCPYAYITLSQSIDLFKIDPADITVPLITVAFDTDLLIPQPLMQTLSNKSAGWSKHYVINTTYGHDGFLKEPQALSTIFNTHLGESL